MVGDATEEEKIKTKIWSALQILIYIDWMNALLRHTCWEMIPMKTVVTFQYQNISHLSQYLSVLFSNERSGLFPEHRHFSFSQNTCFPSHDNFGGQFSTKTIPYIKRNQTLSVLFGLGFSFPIKHHFPWPKEKTWQKKPDWEALSIK